MNLKHLAMLALFLSLAMAISGFQSDRVGPPEASPTRSMKGHELHSWQMQGEWYFALVVGTNRIKTYDEISSPEVRVKGLETLKGELDQLPNGEQIFWSAQRVPNTGLPPHEMIDEVRTYCRQRGIQLVIEQTPLPDDATEATMMPAVVENANQATPEATPSPAIGQTAVPWRGRHRVPCHALICTGKSKLSGQRPRWFSYHVRRWALYRVFLMPALDDNDKFRNLVQPFSVL